MIVALVVGPIAGFIYIMKAPDVFARTLPEALTLAGPAKCSITGAMSGFAAGAGLMGGLSWFFGYLGGQPQLSTRFMAIRDPRSARLGRNIGIAWTLLAYTGALLIGWLGLAIFGPEGLSDCEFVMPRVMFEVFPDFIAAILVTGAIAAMISTADSLLILSATELSENLAGAIGEKKARGLSALSRSRVITAALAAVALFVAYVFPSDLIYTLVGFVWAGIGSTFSIVILLTLFWKRYHGRAVVVTIVAGMLFTIVWHLTGMEKLLTARLTTFVFAALVAVVSTLAIPSGRSGE
jgi:sodium/proline symporter